MRFRQLSGDLQAKGDSDAFIFAELACCSENSNLTLNHQRGLYPGSTVNEKRALRGPDPSLLLIPDNLAGHNRGNFSRLCTHASLVMYV